MKTKRVCIICGGSLAGKARAKEHAAPAWLQKHLALTKARVESLHVGFPKGGLSNDAKLLALQTERPAAFALGKLLAGRVCARCNNGWMSKLETDTKIFLAKLIDGSMTIDALSADERRTLAKWTLKTAFMFEYATPKRIATWAGFVDVDHVRKLVDDKLPDGLALFAMQTKEPVGAPGYYADINRRWPTNFPGNFSHREWVPYQAKSYKVTFHFGHLISTVAYLPPHPSSRFALWPGVHEIVWPSSPPTTDVDWTLPFAEHAVVFDLTLGVSFGPWESQMVDAIINGVYRKVRYHEVVVAQFWDRIYKVRTGKT